MIFISSSIQEKKQLELPIYGIWRYQALYKFKTRFLASALSAESNGRTCLKPPLSGVVTADAILTNPYQPVLTMKIIYFGSCYKFTTLDGISMK